jgi:hypothetical protein
MPAEPGDETGMMDHRQNASFTKKKKAILFSATL